MKPQGKTGLDVVGCADCRRPMQGGGGVEICRWYGLPTGPVMTEDGCKQFEPRVQQADRVWFDDACCYGKAA